MKHSKMAISVSKRKSRPSEKEEETNKRCCFGLLSEFTSFLFKIPALAIALVIIFLWSSSTTIISGNIVHVCVSSRKLNNLYCLSAGAGAKPNFDIPVPMINESFSADAGAKQKFDIPVPTIDESVSADTGAKQKFDIPVPNINESFSVGADAKPSFDIPVPTISESFSAGAGAKPNFDSSILSINESFMGQSASKVDEHEQIYSYPQNKSFDTVRADEQRNKIANAVKSIGEQLQLHRSWKAKNVNRATCDGRGIFVYDLPRKFNKDLLGQCDEMIPWLDFCKFLTTNQALGEPMPKLGKDWYQTHQYSLEPIFHDRIVKHPCRVQNPNEAKLFYVPFYGGLDILRWHFNNVSNDVKDSLSLELMKWMSMQKTWTKKSGKDHVFVLGKISWDFRRYSHSSWGSRLLELQEMQNPIKILLERQPWHENDIAIPHPTHFHPHSDQDIISWQKTIISSSRDNLVSFAGAARPGSPENIRSTLIKQCTSAKPGKCKILSCKSGFCGEPEAIIDLFLKSEFCLQPPGDSPTRKSVFDSLVSGCIPVIFDPFTAYYQYPWHLPKDHGKYSVFMDQEEVREGKVNVVERLMKISVKERDDMRRYIVYELLPGLVYGDLDAQFDRFQDAFAITINNLLERVSKLE